MAYHVSDDVNLEVGIRGIVKVDIVSVIILAIVAGGFIGSLINMVATRLPADLEVIGPPVRSDDGCQDRRALTPYIGSWDRQTGNVDWPNLGTQIGAACVVGASSLIHSWSLAFLQAIVLASLLLVILRIDWQHHLIFILTIWPGIIVALIFSALQSWTSILSSIGAGMLAAGLFQLLYLLAILIYRKRALGFGDVLLAGLIGTMVGLQLLAVTLMFGMVLAAIGGLILILIRARTRSDYIPYGAYLSFAAMVIVVLAN